MGWAGLINTGNLKHGLMVNCKMTMSPEQLCNSLDGPTFCVHNTITPVPRTQRTRLPFLFNSMKCN